MNRPMLPTPPRSTLHSLLGSGEPGGTLSVHHLSPPPTALNRRSVEPLLAPAVLAFDILESHCTHARCCALSPVPPARFPRIPLMCIGTRRSAASAIAVLVSWPPPSSD